MLSSALISNNTMEDHNNTIRITDHDCMRGRIYSNVFLAYNSTSVYKIHFVTLIILITHKT